MDETISKEQLQPGDVLLSLGKGSLSECIRLMDGGLHSHGAIWTGDKLVEATISEGVIEESLEVCIGRHPHRYIDVYRREGGGKVVERARAWAAKKHQYSRGDLKLCAFLLVSSALWPVAALQVAYLLAANAIESFLELDEPKDGERVTCIELIARVFYEAGVPLAVRPQPGHLVDPKLLKDAIEELKNHKGLEPDSGPSEEQLREKLDLLRKKYVALTGADPVVAGDALRRKGFEAPWMIAGGDWNANFVTPRNLATSRDLKAMGRLYTGRIRD